MRLSFFTFSFFLLGTIYAAPLTIDPDYMKELQMNPNFEHHRPSNADYTQYVTRISVSIIGPNALPKSARLLWR